MGYTFLVSKIQYQMFPLPNIFRFIRNEIMLQTVYIVKVYRLTHCIMNKIL